MMVTIGIDPLIVASLDRIAHAKGVVRTQLIRDALYSYVWDARRNGAAAARRAPGFSKLLEGQALRVAEGKLAPVDEWGLLV